MELNEIQDSKNFLLSLEALSHRDLSELSLKLLGDDLRDEDISFLDSKKFIDMIPRDLSLFILCPNEMQSELTQLFPEIVFIGVTDPRLTFYKLHNSKAELGSRFLYTSKVSYNSQIHKSAQVSENGVQIGSNCIIEEFVSIKPGTIIGDNCIIQAGSRLGDSGFEFKRTSDGILAVNHDAGLIIGNNVQVGANSTVGRGFLGKDTSIGDDTKIDFGVSIAHRSSIGKRVFIAAGVVVSGSTQIGSDTWIGPSAVISNGLTIGERSHIALGSVVVKSFPENSWLMGVPARNVPKS